MRDWRQLSDQAQLTLDECADIAGCSKGTLYKHRYAGLLVWTPGRPCTVPVRALKLYLKMMTNGVKPQLHRTLRIDAVDRAPYSCLGERIDLTANTEKIVEDVVRETHMIWSRYKAAEKKAKRKS